MVWYVHSTTSTRILRSGETTNKKSSISYVGEDDENMRWCNFYRCSNAHFVPLLPLLIGKSCKKQVDTSTKYYVGFRLFTTNIFQIENEWLQSLHREKRDKKTENSTFCVFKPGS